MAWYYRRGGVETGPVSSAELKEAASLGRVDADTPVRRDTDERWVPASKVRGLEFDELIFPPPLPASPDPVPAEPGKIRIQPVARTPQTEREAACCCRPRRLCYLAWRARSAARSGSQAGPRATREIGAMLGV